MKQIRQGKDTVPSFKIEKGKCQLKNTRTENVPIVGVCLLFHMNNIEKPLVEIYLRH